jgi:microcystin-dependent protein
VTSLETGDTSSGDVACFILYMPRVDWFKQNVVGQLSDMTEAENWTEMGTVTREQAAIIAVNMVRGLIVVNFDPIPAGRVEAFAGSTTPDGWLDCDGASYATVDYPELFAKIGYVWGGSGASFNVPDLRDKVILGSGNDFSLADTGGEQTHTLDLAEIPSHNHLATGTSVVDLGHTHVEGSAIPTAILIGAGVPAPSAIPSPSVTAVGFANLSVTDPSISSAGADGAHNNMQPFAALKMIIFAGR